MCPFSLFLLLLLSPILSSFASSQHKNDSSFLPGDCSSPDTFVCPREGACIPSDWVGDGESDCEDGADEAADIGAGRDDPFGILTGAEQSHNDSSEADQLAISPAFFFPPIPSPNSSFFACPNCSQPLEVWVGQLVEMLDSHDNRSSASIFGHPKCRSLLSRACPLLTVCGQCPSNSLSVSSLFPWTRLQLFLCELLEPTLRDHSKCLGTIPSDCARTATASVFLSPHCRFLDRTIRSVQCLETDVPSECSESALEMIGPLRSEAEHWMEELKCEPRGEESDQKTTALPSVPSNSAPSPTLAPPSLAPSPFIPSSSAIFRPIASFPSQSLSSNSTDLRDQQHKDRLGVDSEILWDALWALARADEICSKEAQQRNEWATEGATAIVSKICERIDVLAKGKCLEELARKEGGKCTNGTHATANSSAAFSCALIDSFGKSIECAVKALNELCPAEVEEAVVGIQEQLNDEAIARQCFAQRQSQEAAPANVATEETHDEFPLNPVHPKCSSEQEESSLVCLVELAELNGRLQRLGSLQLLIADNATLASVCEVFSRYEQCLAERVFSAGKGPRGARCSLNSPLNALARIGLSPLCSSRSRLFLLDRSSACLNAPLAHCHAPMEAVGRAVGAMLQGVHGQAHMCKAFYSLRSAFRCGQQTMRERCAKETETAKKMDEHLTEMQRKLESLGREEGCPAEEPSNLEELLSRRVLPAGRPPVGAAPLLTLRGPTAPQARPLPTADALTPKDNQCDEQQQQLFNECVQPLTAFQPHPLAVIKQPKLIDQACQAFRNFSECRLRAQCFPLWARGMSAMFDFACGPRGSALYSEVRQCIRRNIARPNMKECVVAFSHGAPKDACPSARTLLSCAVPELSERCGEKAVQFVHEYVAVFAKAVDPNCALMGRREEERDNGGQTDKGETREKGEMRENAGQSDKEEQNTEVGMESGRKGPIAALNCSDEQQQLVRHCAAPLEALHAQLGELFEGGLQNVLKNLNGLAPLFAQGCMLGAEFRQCLSSLSSSSAADNESNRCVVSSCLVAAGAGICDQSDATQAIDTHLGCVFKQVSDPEFGKCLRTTLVPIKQFSLASLRQALPQFVDCVHEIVQRTCGPIPLNVLHVLASKDNICPVNGPKATEQSEGKMASPALLAPTTCTTEMKQIRLGCQRDFLLAKYTFRPVSLLRLISNSSNASSSIPSSDAFCAADFAALSQCMRRTAPCDADEPYGRARALRALGTAICSARAEFSQLSRCVEAVTEGVAGRKCEAQNKSGGKNGTVVDELLEKDTLGEHDAGTLCAMANDTTQCLAPAVFSECGTDSLEFMFSASNEYLAQIIPGNGCQLEMPSLAIEHSTGCAEQELVAYLECESHVDHFRPRPLALISNQSEWDGFCHSVQKMFKPCMEALKCRPEPAAGAALTLYDTVCEREITSRDQRRFGTCLLNVTESASIRPCLSSFRLVDLLGTDAGPRVCAAVNDLLQCAANTINEQCGEEALLHVYDVYNGWSNAFHRSCELSPPNLTKSHDEEKELMTIDVSTTTTKLITTKEVTTQRTTQMEKSGRKAEEGTDTKGTTPAATTTTAKGTTTKGTTEKPKGPNGAVTPSPIHPIAFSLPLLAAFFSLCSWRPFFLR
ncbi:hypothetical protein niasHS_006663 [Heterodera schachtii]|uniref:T20D4.11-like domain-containing protein n=1 Tax=Heterodera schachtii TaxID=97005 RepID=A0ABD2JHW6_HETSC